MECQCVCRSHPRKKGNPVTKPELLALLRLLSAVETALLMQKANLPDHLWEAISTTCEKVEQEILQ